MLSFLVIDLRGGYIPPMNTQDIVARIKARRSEQGLNQGQLGEMVGVSRASISSIERGIHSPGSDLLLALLDAVGLKVQLLDK